MNRALLDYYRCPASYTDLHLVGELCEDMGYFRFGQAIVGYGALAYGKPCKSARDHLYDALKDVKIERGKLLLPFHLTHIVDNLRHERYCLNFRPDQSKYGIKGLIRNIYYSIRPILPVSIRKFLQRIYMQDWESIGFPRWPVDHSVETTFKQILALLLSAYHIEKLPFIWFWPNGYQGCTIITHDVETAQGQDFCPSLMDINDSFGVKSSFQFIPAERYILSKDFLSDIRDRGFEINIHDLNHDGHLFEDKEQFLRRAQRINQYVKEYAAIGFRSGVMYRNVDWYDAFEFSYDMSVPNVAHLDPQRGGCCTVMPYFIGKILELPLTTIQDYALFNILNVKSIDLWKQQIKLITENNGLLSFLIHPDYIIKKQYQYLYYSLLEHLIEVCNTGNIWVTLPKAVDEWWRKRSKMYLVDRNGQWHIEGEGSQRACIAYASLTNDGRVIYEIQA
jgi:hypothetical protein